MKKRKYFSFFIAASLFVSYINTPIRMFAEELGSESEIQDKDENTPLNSKLEDQEVSEKSSVSVPEKAMTEAEDAVDSEEFMSNSQEVQTGSKDTSDSSANNMNDNSVIEDKNVDKSAEKEWAYAWDESKQAYKLQKYIGESTNIIIPTEINNKPVFLSEIGGHLFSDATAIQSITTDYETTGKKIKVQKLRSAFSAWVMLEHVDLSGLDTSDVNDMAFMFNRCVNLKTVNLRGFDTSKVVRMNSMFQRCQKLTTLDLSSFDTSKVEDMSYMFNQCGLLTDLNLKSFNTSKVQLMEAMFHACDGLSYLDLSSFDTRNVKSFYATFLTSTQSPLLIRTADETLKNLNYSGFNRRKLEIIFNANGGRFSDNQTSKNYFDSFVIDPNDSKLQLETFNKYKKELLPKKEGAIFKEWKTENNVNATSVLDLVDSEFFAEYEELPDELVNGSFEQPMITSPIFSHQKDCYFQNFNNIPGWKNTVATHFDVIKSLNESDKLQAVEGKQWLEPYGANGNKTYQDIKTTPGDTYYWEVYHRGRFGSDSAAVEIGDSNKDMNQQCVMQTGVSDWKKYSGYYKVPEGQTVTRFQINSISTSNFGLDTGNFIDNVIFTNKITNKKSKLTINFVDEQGNTIKSSKEVEGYKGQSYDWSSSNPETAITGYKLDESMLPNNVKGTFTEEDQEITLLYKVIDSNIPSKEENMKPDVLSGYGIAYLPKKLTIDTTTLNDRGKQEISVQPMTGYHVGVRDQRMVKSNWALQAQLIWEKKDLPGSYIKTSNATGEVKKNINDGVNDFKESDLVENDSGVTGGANVKIGTTMSQLIMAGKNQNHNAVYDYNLGEVSLVLENTDIVQQGSYQGYIKWNLSSVPT